LSTIAFFKVGVPSTAVYFVSPSFIACMAASLILSGVSKSGSPAPNPITSFPAALSSLALPEIPADPYLPDTRDKSSHSMPT